MDKQNLNKTLRISDRKRIHEKIHKEANIMRTCNQTGCNKPVHRDTYMCRQHLKEYRSAYYQKTKHKLKHEDNRKYNSEKIKRELSGEINIPGGIYEGCTHAQIRALQSDGIIDLLPEVRNRSLKKSD